MAIGTDKVQVWKSESTALGGQDGDQAPFQNSVPINAQEDAVESAGHYFQDAVNRDELVYVARDGDDLVFRDVTTGTTYTLSQLISATSRRPAVINIVDCTAAPPTEVTDDRYILDDTVGTVHADWDGAAKNDIVEFGGSTWAATTPSDAWVAFATTPAKDAIYLASSSTWELMPAGPTSHAMTSAVHIAGNNKLFYSNASGTVTELALDADGTYLKSNGPTAAPTFDTPTAARVGLEIYVTSNKSLSSLIQPVDFDGQTYEDDNSKLEWEGVTNPDRFTMKEAGDYEVLVTGFLGGVSANDLGAFGYARVNGSTRLNQTDMGLSDAAWAGVASGQFCCTFTYTASANDYIEICLGETSTMAMEVTSMVCRVRKV